MNVKDIREHFISELKNENFTIDKTGMKTIEMIGANFIADEDAIFGTVNKAYVDAELEWYESMSTNIKDIIYGPKGLPPQAWTYAANKHGEINSNYGKLIFSPLYYNQFDKALKELLKNPDTRRAIMVYNRPSIWEEFNDNEKNDFICTNAVCYYIRDGKMHAVVQMRSNDVVFGYKNDRAWAEFVLNKLVYYYNNAHDGDFVKPGNIHWQVQNIHCYERHFHLVK